SHAAALEVYACGPEPMLEAVRRLCAATGTPAQLALESGMACGYGACFGCVVAPTDGDVRLCVDGPGLDAARRAFGDDLLLRFPSSVFVSKTVTVAPRDGNPPPRLWELAAGLMNSIG